MASRSMRPALSGAIVDSRTKINIWNIVTIPGTVWFFSTTNSLQNTSTRLRFTVFVCIYEVPEASWRRIVVIVAALVTHLALQSAGWGWSPFRVWGALARRLAALIKRIVIYNLICSNTTAAGHCISLSILERHRSWWRRSRCRSWHGLAMRHLSWVAIRRAVRRSIWARSWWSVRARRP